MLRFKARKRRQPAIQLTPLIDMVFLLLIYFLLTSAFITQSGLDVSLPRVRSLSGETESGVVVRVDARGVFHMDDRRIEAEGLSALLREALNARGTGEVTVEADRAVAYDRVVEALDAARSAGARTLFLAAVRESESAGVTLPPGFHPSASPESGRTGGLRR